MDSNAKRFWAQFAAWATLALILPVGFIVWRYDLFRTKTVTQFGAWGFIAIVIVAAFAIACLRYAKAGMKEWSMTKQVIMGVCRITIPLLALCFALRSMADSIDLLVQALAVATACETAAIPLNPFPKWVWERTKGEYESLIDYAFRKYDERKEAKKGE